MSHSEMTEEALLTEAEVSGRLGISVERLHRVLDEHIFNNGERRPAKCLFRSSDLLLISYWLRTEMTAKVLPMPRRN